MNWQELLGRDFPGGPVVKDLPCDAGNTGSIPDRKAKIPHAMEQLSLRTAPTDPSRHEERAHRRQLRPEAAR